MKLVVVHDERGHIVSMARAELATEEGLQAGLSARPDHGQWVLELDVPDQLATHSPSEIAAQYRVDTKAKQLTKGADTD